MHRLFRRYNGMHPLSGILLRGKKAVGAISLLQLTQCVVGTYKWSVSERNRRQIACFAILVSAWSLDISAYAHTIVNSTVNNNTTNIVVKTQQTLIITQSSSAIRTSEPPSTFAYQPHELLPYMSPRCAQLYEAQLNRYKRRMSATVAAGVSDEFQSKCLDSVAEARRSLFQAKIDKRNTTQDQNLAAKRSAEQDQSTREQCGELHRILVAKRKRLDSMTDGEKADHARVEGNFSANCKGQ